MDAGHRADERPPVRERDADVERLGGRAAGPGLGLGDDRVDDRVDGVDHRLAQHARGQLAAGDLGEDRGPPVDAAEARLEQPLADVPALEAVELDREGVGDLVVEVAHAHVEPLAQEGAHRVLDEADEVVELDHVAAGGRQRAGEERRRLGARGGERAGAAERDRVEAPTGLAPASKLRGSNGCSGWRVTTPASASIASSSSPTGTAGGRVAFVRSSLPV